MVNLGLIVIGSNYSDVFSITDIYNVKSFVNEAEENAKFIAEVYNIFRPWEIECLEDYLIDNMRWRTFFYQCADESFVVVSDSFTLKNLEKKAIDFINLENKFAETIAPIIALKSIDKKELSITLFVDGLDKSSVSIRLNGKSYKVYWENENIIKKYLNITEDVLNSLITEYCEFEKIVNALSDELKLPLNISFDKVRCDQKRLNAYKFDTRS